MPYYNMVLVMECGQNMKIGQIVFNARCRILQSEFQFLHLIIIMHSIDRATGAHVFRNLYAVWM